MERTPASGRPTGERLDEEEVDVTLTEQRPVVDKETVATEDVHVGTRTVHDTERVTTDVSREELDMDNAAGGRGRDGDRLDNAGRGDRFDKNGRNDRLDNDGRDDRLDNDGRRDRI